jgi:3-phosphoshikimate 1-carboxyvinyltransferase
VILNCPPAHFLKGCIHLPASKSYSIRASIIAAYGGKSQIKHLSNCDDAIVAEKVAKQLKKGDRAKALSPFFLEGEELSGSLPRRGRAREGVVFSVGESGTTLRFLLPLLSLHTQRAKVMGRGTLVGRPNAHLCAALRRQGMDIRGRGKKESVPIVFKGGRLRAGRVSIDGSLSSQFISALLIALPRLQADSHVILTGHKLVSLDYTQMTIQILKRAGIIIQKVSEREYVIKGGQKFKGLKNFYVPSDYGLAAFAMAACALLPSEVTLQGNLDKSLVQSDGHIFEFLRKMGGRIKKTRREIKVKGPFNLKGGSFSLKDCPDLVPIMSILALFAKGKTRLIGIHHARTKESDRISDLRKELLKIGARVSESKGALTIYPRASYKRGQLLDSHHDHRLAMAFTVLGMKIGCRVKGIESCRKSYPGFVRDMKALGALSAGG